MLFIEETITDPVARSQSSAQSSRTDSSESYSYSTSGSVPGGGAFGQTAQQADSRATAGNDQGASSWSGGSYSWSESGSYSSNLTFSSSSNETNSTGGTSTSTQGTSTGSSSYSRSGSSDRGGSSSGGTSETHGSQTTAGSSQSYPSASLGLNSTASGTGDSLASAFTQTYTYTTVTPTFTTTSSGSSTGRTTTTASTSASGITTTNDSSHYLSRLFDTIISAAAGNGIDVRRSAVVFDFSEDAWLIRLSNQFAGMKDLTDIGSHLGSSYAFPTSTQGSATIGMPPTSTFASYVQGLATSTSESDFTGLSTATSSANALSVPPQAIPNATQETDFTAQTLTSSSTAIGVNLSTPTSSSFPATGSSASASFSTLYNTTVSVPTFASDLRGRIIGTTFTTSQSLVSTTLLSVFAASTGGVPSTTTGGSGVTNYTGTDTSILSAAGCTTSSGSTSAAGTTTTSAVPAYSANSFLAQATILEATFDPAVRAGTAGKYSSVSGPSAPVGYPFWSQVWSSLWAPMTYGESKTATCAVRTNSAAGASSQTYSATFNWASGGVQMTTASGSGTATAGGSTSFSLSPVNSDSGTFSISRGADERGNYVVGGTQWGGAPAQLWLGRGIWSMTTNDSSGGSSTGRVTVTDPASISSIDNSHVVAAQPIPAWECVTANSGDPCIAVFTSNS